MNFACMTLFLPLFPCKNTQNVFQLLFCSGVIHNMAFHSFRQGDSLANVRGILPAAKHKSYFLELLMSSPRPPLPHALHSNRVPFVLPCSFPFSPQSLPRSISQVLP